MVKFKVSALLPISAENYFVERDSAAFRSLVAEMCKLESLEIGNSWVEGATEVYEFVTRPDIERYVPHHFKHLLPGGDLHYTDIIEYDPALLQASPFRMRVRSIPPIFASKARIESWLVIEAVGPDACRQTLEGSIDIKVLGLGGLAERIIVDNLRGVYRGVPKIVERWAKFRREVLAQPGGQAVLVQGRPRNEGVGWINDSIRALIKAPSPALPPSGNCRSLMPPARQTASAAAVPSCSRRPARRQSLTARRPCAVAGAGQRQRPAQPHVGPQQRRGGLGLPRALAVAGAAAGAHQRGGLLCGQRRPGVLRRARERVVAGPGRLPRQRRRRASGGQPAARHRTRAGGARARPQVWPPAAAGGRGRRAGGRRACQRRRARGRRPLQRRVQPGAARVARLLAGARGPGGSARAGPRRAPALAPRQPVPHRRGHGPVQAGQAARQAQAAQQRQHRQQRACRGGGRALGRGLPGGHAEGGGWARRAGQAQGPPALPQRHLCEGPLHARPQARPRVSRALGQQQVGAAGRGGRWRLRPLCTLRTADV